MTANEEQAKSLFLAALECAPERWPALLDDGCRGNAELRARVEQLLYAHQALGEIGGEAAVQGLVEVLHDQSPDVRVIAIEALGKLNAKETLPSLRLLLDDHERSHFGELVSVSDAALAAITKLEQR